MNQMRPYNIDLGITEKAYMYSNNLRKFSREPQAKMHKYLAWSILVSRRLKFVQIEQHRKDIRIKIYHYMFLGMRM